MIRRILHILLTGAVFCAAADPQTGKTFSTPEEARDALIQAAAKGFDAVKEIFGSNSTEMLRTGDAIEYRNALTRFNLLASEKAELERDETDPNTITLTLGKIEWPF